MRPAFLSVLALLLCAPAFAVGLDLAIVSGFPNEKLPYVKNTLKEKIDLSLDSFVSDDVDSGAFYFASRNGVGAISAIQVLGGTGSTTMELFQKGLSLAAERAPVVLSPIGGKDMTEACETMATHPETAFLMVTGGDGTRDTGEPACFASNILFATGLNKERTDLAGYQQFGGKIRVAVPLANLAFPVENGKKHASNTKAHGLSMVAGHMAQITRAEPYLRGAALIQRFLDTRTEYVPALAGKVINGRALVYANE